LSEVCCDQDGVCTFSLYNLYPSANVLGLPAAGFSSGESLRLMEEIAARTLPPCHRMDRHFPFRKGRRQPDLLIFAKALLLVYLVLAGQYERWYTPLSVILSVPLALIGPRFAAIAATHRHQSLCADRHHPVAAIGGQERDTDPGSGARRARQRG